MARLLEDLLALGYQQGWVMQALPRFILEKAVMGMHAGIRKRGLKKEERLKKAGKQRGNAASGRLALHKEQRAKALGPNLCWGRRGGRRARMREG